MVVVDVEEQAGTIARICQQRPNNSSVSSKSPITDHGYQPRQFYRSAVRRGT
jgi:hypothetical protein